MKYLLPLFLVGFFLTKISAQDDRIAPLPIDLENIDLLEMTPLDNKDLIREEMRLRKPGRPNHFAHTFYIDQSSQEIGEWTTLPDGSKVWRLRIHSKNAKSLNLGFSKYKMPSGGTLVMYTPDFENILGPFTPADNEDHEELWTPVVDGDDLIVEVWLKENNRDNLELELKSVNHDFIGINSSMFLSGSCNLDVICSELDGWGMVDDYRDIIQSVALTQLNGALNCTGFLVNNTAEDCTPLFMTANHCGLNAASAPSLVTYWNYENSTCRQPFSIESGAEGDGSLNDFNTGSELRGTWASSDFTIVELDDPVNTSAQAFRAGWNATDTLATNVIGIHQPSRDEKRISFSDQQVFIGDWNGNNVNNHVEVPDWDVGTTEGGSSGSPIFDQNKRVVGQLHGGTAACGNNGSDSYGWFNASWEGGGTPGTRLKDWLDPNDSGVMVIDGKNCSFGVIPDISFVEVCAPTDAIYQLTVSDNFSSNVDLTISNLQAGLSATFSNNTPAPGEMITLTISNTASLPFGTYQFTINGTDGMENSTNNLTLNLFDGIPATPVLTTPSDMSTDISNTPFFNWETTSASTYEIEVATDAIFSNIIITNQMIIEEMFATNLFLDSETTYYWRIRGNNLCGTGNWSNIQSFTTANIVCTSNPAIGLPIAIDDGGPNTISSTINFLSSGNISDLNVIGLEGTHTWTSDLAFVLESPAGTSVDLISSICGDQDDFNISFDDQASGTIPCPFTDGGTYPPEEGTLSDFNGENPLGTWTLTIIDSGNGDGGNLNNWSLEICTAPDNTLNVLPSQTEFTVCAGSSTNFDVFIGGGFEGPIQLGIIGGGNGVNLTFNPANPTPGSLVNVTMEVESSVAEGAYDINFSTSDTNNDIPTTLALNVPSNTSPVLGLPIDGSSDVTISPIFAWDNTDSYSSLNLLVSLDPNFGNNIIVDEDLPVDDTNYIYPNSLVGGTTYYWQISGTNECGDRISNTFSFTTETTTGIEEIAAQHIEFYPNPTPGNLTINLSYPFNGVIQGQIYHVNGSLLDKFQIPFGAATHNLDLSNLPTGIYVVKLKHSDFIVTNKIILN